MPTSKYGIEYVQDGSVSYPADLDAILDQIDGTVSDAERRAIAEEVQPTSGALQSQKNWWSWPDIPWEDKGQAIIDGSSLGSTSSDGASYPTVIDASAVFDNPLDNYYIYWSGHDSPTGIHLTTAPSLWGPWTLHGEVLPDTTAPFSGGGHIASPSAVYDPERDRLNLYVHTNMNDVSGGAGQSSYLYTTPETGDGASNYTYQNQVLKSENDDTWDCNQQTYFEVRRVNGSWWGVYQGRDDEGGAVGIGVAHSFDGVNWTTEPTPAFDNTQWGSYDPRGFNGGSPTLSVVGGEPYIHHNDRLNGDSLALPFEDRDKAMFQTGEVVYSIPSWAPASANSVGAYDFMNDEEYLYMFYLIGADGALRIGEARAPIDVVKQ